MEEQQLTHPSPEFTASMPAPGETLGLLLPLAAPIAAYIARAAVDAYARRQKAKIENQVDTREYLQQQNEALLREILERDDSKSQ